VVHFSRFTGWGRIRAFDENGQGWQRSHHKNSENRGPVPALRNTLRRTKEAALATSRSARGSGALPGDDALDAQPSSATVAATVRSEYWGLFVSVDVAVSRKRPHGRRRQIFERVGRMLKRNGGDDGARTRDLRRKKPAFAARIDSYFQSLTGSRSPLRYREPPVAAVGRAKSSK
jgi:hypothetical protein